MKCKECGNELEDGARFCSSCGKKVIKEKYCSNCGKLLPDGVRFCSACGTAALGDEPEPDETEINPPEDYSTYYETNTREQIEHHDQEQTEQTVQTIEPEPDYSRTEAELTETEPTEVVLTRSKLQEKSSKDIPQAETKLINTEQSTEDNKESKKEGKYWVVGCLIGGMALFVIGWLAIKLIGGVFGFVIGAKDRVMDANPGLQSTIDSFIYKTWNFVSYYVYRYLPFILLCGAIYWLAVAVIGFRTVRTLTDEKEKRCTKFISSGYLIWSIIVFCAA